MNYEPTTRRNNSFWTPHKILDWAQHIAASVFFCLCLVQFCIFDYVGFHVVVIVFCLCSLFPSVASLYWVDVSSFMTSQAARMIESDYNCIEHNSTIKPLTQSIKYGLTHRDREKKNRSHNPKTTNTLNIFFCIFVLLFLFLFFWCIET